MCARVCARSTACLLLFDDYASNIYVTTAHESTGSALGGSNWALVSPFILNVHCPVKQRHQPDLPSTQQPTNVKNLLHRYGPRQLEGEGSLSSAAQRKSKPRVFSTGLVNEYFGRCMAPSVRAFLTYIHWAMFGAVPDLTYWAWARVSACRAYYMRNY